MKKTYRTANGKTVDLQSLILKNEEVRAVGNMSVNARGDVISPENKKVASRSEQVNKQYRKQHGNLVRDIPVASSKRAAEEMERKVAEEIAKTTTAPTTIEGLDEVSVEDIAKDAEVATEDKTEKSGLASAIDKVRKTKKESTDEE